MLLRDKDVTKTGNGEWGMGNGEWEIENGKLNFFLLKRGMGNGKLRGEIEYVFTKKGNGNFKLVRFLLKRN